MPAADLVPEPLHAAGVTPRELQIFWLVADRLHNREIADRLHLSERTVESHVSSLLGKLGARDRQTLVDTAARLRTSLQRGSGLPSQLSSFIGREREIEELQGLIAAYRMVTLIGPAGSGKTRLALRVAESIDSVPPVLVDLATVPPRAEVERLFADALGIAVAGSGLRATMRRVLADGRHWLVVDNCEHVAEATARLLADLLASAARLRVLATSHGPLGVAGEAVYVVAPLPLPPDNDDPRQVLEADSARLFAERAGAASPSFTLTAENARAVAGVCRRVDGLPLAIELAAARMRAFSAAELLARLDDLFELLTAGVHGPGVRHLSLEAALRWSYDLLEDDERLLFERCAVFPGDFDYDTGADVLSYPPLARADLARLFPRLLDRSLISATQHHESTEYRMLDSIRRLARDRLAARGELERVQSEHASYHLARGAAVAVDLQGHDQAAALEWFDRHWGDLRAVMRWTLDRGDTESAWKFLAGVGFCWDVLGIRAELFEWLDTLLGEPLPSGPLGVEARVTAAVLLWFQDPERALTLAEAACRQAESEDDRHQALAHLVLGRVERSLSQTAALGHLETATATFQRLGDEWHYALAIDFLGEAQPEVERALAHYARAAAVFGRLGDDVTRANCLNQAAARCVDDDAHLGEAEAWLAEAHRLAELSRNRHELLHAELFRARLDQRRGEHAAAGPVCHRLLPEFRRIGDSRCVARCLVGLGWAAVVAGQQEVARRHLTECVEIAVHAMSGVDLASALRLLAELDRDAGVPWRAARLLGAAEAAAERLDPDRRRALLSDAGLRTHLEHELGAEAFETALDEGRRTPGHELARASADEITSKQGPGVGSS